MLNDPFGLAAFFSSCCTYEPADASTTHALYRAYLSFLDREKAYCRAEHKRFGNTLVTMGLTPFRLLGQRAYFRIAPKAVDA